MKPTQTSCTITLPKLAAKTPKNGCLEDLYLFPFGMAQPGRCEITVSFRGVQVQITQYDPYIYPGIPTTIKNNGC